MSSKLYANFVKKGQVKQNELGDDFTGTRKVFEDGVEEEKDVIDETKSTTDDLSTYKTLKRAYKTAKRAADEAEALAAHAIAARDEAWQAYQDCKNERKLKKRKREAEEE